MTTLNTAHGVVTVTNAQMARNGGYGMYTITLNIEIGGNKHNLNFQSTDSKMFDKLEDMDTNDDRSNYILSVKNFDMDIEEFVASI